MGLVESIINSLKFGLRNSWYLLEVSWSVFMKNEIFKKKINWYFKRIILLYALVFAIIIGEFFLIFKYPIFTMYIAIGVIILIILLALAFGYLAAKLLFEFSMLTYLYVSKKYHNYFETKPDEIERYVEAEVKKKRKTIIILALVDFLAKNVQESKGWSGILIRALKEIEGILLWFLAPALAINPRYSIQQAIEEIKRYRKYLIEYFSMYFGEKAFKKLSGIVLFFIIMLIFGLIGYALSRFLGGLALLISLAIGFIVFLLLNAYMLIVVTFLKGIYMTLLYVVITRPEEIDPRFTKLLEIIRSKK